MEMLLNVVNYILGFGAAVFVPLIMLLVGLLVKMKLSDAFIAALTLGVAFTGMNMLVNFMTGAVSPAAQGLATNTGITLTSTDIGWPALSAIAWAWPLGVLCFPLHVLVNMVMLAINKTSTLNVDLWNCWNKLLTTVLVYYFALTAGIPEGTAIALGFAAATIECVLELKFGDMWAPSIEKITGIPGVTVPHAMAFTAVLILPFDKLLDKIPAIRDADFDAKWLRSKIGIFGENAVMGFIIGVALGVIAYGELQQALTLGIQAATAMQLFPMVSKLFMQALSPISDAVGEFMKKRFHGRELYVGLDWPILAGSNELWVTTILLIPFELLLAVALVPVGNSVLPFAGIVNICLAVPLLLITGGNLLKMVIIGIIMTPVYLLVSSAIAPYVTDLARTYAPSALEGIAEGALITWSTPECPDFRYLIAEAFSGNIIGIVGLIAWFALFVWLYKDFQKRNVKIKEELGH